MGTLTTAFLMIAVLVATGFPAFSAGGFNSRDSTTQLRVDAMKLIDQDPDLKAWWHSPTHTNANARELSSSGDGDACPRITSSMRPHVLYYEATGGNMLEEAALLGLCELERLQAPKATRYAELCRQYTPCRCPAQPQHNASQFPLMALCGDAHPASKCDNIVNPDGSGALSLTHPQLGVFIQDTSKCELAPQWQQVLRGLANVEAAYDVHTARAMKQNVLYMFDKGFESAFNSTGELRSQFMRSRLVFQGPELEDWISDSLAPQILTPDSPAIRVFFADRKAMQRQMNKDMQLALVSFLVVTCYMWFNTRSLFITICGMFSIIMSFPLAFFAWRVLLRQQFFGTLMMMSLFIVLGIGADDVFVLQDAWTQSAAQPRHISGSRETRFAWAYRRASNAMLTTSFTTFMAFVATAMTPVPAIKSFGIFAAFVVLFTYLLVITWFAAAVMLHDKHFVSTSAPYQCGHDAAVANYCCGCGPKLPICSQLSHGDSELSWRERDAAAKEGRGKTRRASVLVMVEALRTVPLRLFNSAPVLNKFTTPILAGFGVLFVAMALLAWFLLVPAHQLGDFFPEDHPVTRLKRISTDGFKTSSSDNKFRIAIVWGMHKDAPIDRAGTDMNDPKQLGALQFDPSWASRQVQLQTEMARACDTVAAYVPAHTGKPSLVATHASAG